MLFANRVGYLLAALVPALTIGHPSALVIGIFVLFSTPGHFYNVGWNALLGDVTPEHRRAQVFAARSIILSLGTTFSVFIAGRWLSRTPFPGNYQILYLVGFGTAMISLYYVSQLRPTAPGAGQPAESVPYSRKQTTAELIRQVRAEPHFLRIVVNTLAHGVGVWLVAPVYVLFYVGTLQAQEGWLGTNAMVATLVPVVGFYLWQRIIRARGERWVLRLTIMLLGLYPMLVGLTYNLSIILIWTALYGLVAPGVTLSHFNMLLKVIPDGPRPMFLAVYITVMNVGAFAMPLLGAWLAEQINPGPTLVLGGALCILGSSLFLFRPLTAPDSLAARGEIGTS
jgi:Na+/melibiose symporter-like transporter